MAMRVKRTVIGTLRKRDLGIITENDLWVEGGKQTDCRRGEGMR